MTDEKSILEKMPWVIEQRKRLLKERFLTLSCIMTYNSSAATEQQNIPLVEFTFQVKSALKIELVFSHLGVSMFWTSCLDYK